MALMKPSPAVFCLTSVIISTSGPHQRGGDRMAWREIISPSYHAIYRRVGPSKRLARKRAEKAKEISLGDVNATRMLSMRR